MKALTILILALFISTPGFADTGEERPIVVISGGRPLLDKNNEVVVMIGSAIFPLTNGKGLLLSGRIGIGQTIEVRIITHKTKDGGTKHEYIGHATMVR